MNEVVLALEGLRLGYGRGDVIHDVGLAVRAGTIVSLIGANGAGKTTILRGISGLMPLRAGTVRFLGRDVTGEAPHRIAQRGIVQVPEGRQVFANMTVADNLAMGAYRRRGSVADERDRVLSRFPRLRERLDQQAGYLSGGEQQMLAIGRALMADPRILLLDEPSMGLAPLIVEEIFDVIVSLRREGRTVLLVEQNAASALAISDHAYVLEAGHIVIEGPGPDVLHDPRVASAYLGL